MGKKDNEQLKLEKTIIYMKGMRAVSDQRNASKKHMPNSGNAKLAIIIAVAAVILVAVLLYIFNIRDNGEGLSPLDIHRFLSEMGEVEEVLVETEADGTFSLDMDQDLIDLFEEERWLIKELDSLLDDSPDLRFILIEGISIHFYSSEDIAETYREDTHEKHRYYTIPDGVYKELYNYVLEKGEFLEVGTLVDGYLDIIISSPKESSNMYDYIEAHYIEYQNIIQMGEEAFAYILEELDTGNAVGLRKVIMENLIGEMSGEFMAFPTEILDQLQTSIGFDLVEWITSGDTDTIAELGITEEDMPGGFYIHNANESAVFFVVDEDAGFIILDLEKDVAYKEVDLETFKDYLSQSADFTPPYLVTVKDGFIVEMKEQYVP